MTYPTPVQIKSQRVAAGLTMAQASTIVYTELRTWQRWESGESKMHPGLWELFLLKTKQ